MWRNMASRKGKISSNIADFLLEIGTEEIPARFLPGARRQLKDLAGEFFKELCAGSGGAVLAETWATPRRLVVLVKAVPFVQPARHEEVLGPPKAIAFTPDGQPSPALVGFARKSGVDVSSLREVSSEKGPRMAFIKKSPARKTEEYLPQAVTRVIAGLNFPKSMRWPQSSFIFPRPVRWVLALHGAKALDIPGVPSGAVTRGRRFVHPRPLPVKSPADYFAVMKKAGIVIDVNARKDLIKRGAEKLTLSSGGRILWKEHLLGEVSDLVETPVAVRGSFPREALELPQPVLVAAMEEHQRYFPMADADGKLLPYFVTISNGVDTPQVVAGNERVLKARLADARFFFAEDRKRSLDDFLGGLKGAVWQNGAGSMRDKADRLSALAGWLASQVGEDAGVAARAALLCKADLVTQMVGEFPILQGITGGLYAEATLEPPVVARAIGEHYRPVGASDDAPSTGIGCVVSLADRLDNLLGHFALGHAPTGAADPYALRRAAIGVVRILSERGWRLSLSGVLGRAAELFEGQLPGARDWKGGVAPARVFLRDRLSVIFSEEGFQHDEIEACLVSFDDSVLAGKRLAALAVLKARPDFRETILAFSRISNIIPKDFKGAVPAGSAGLDEQERLLWDAHESVREMAEQLAREARFDELFLLLAGMKPAIDLFFEKVMVNDKDEAVRARRLGLVKLVGETIRLFASVRELVIN